MFNMSKIFESRYSKIYLSIFLIIFSLCVFGIPYIKIGFHYDDFVTIFHAKIDSLFGLFKNFSLYRVLDYSTDIAYKNSIALYYRPFLFLVLGIEHFFFRSNAYGYLLFNMFLHGLNAVFILNIFCWFLNIRWAFFGSVLFLLQGCLGGFIYRPYHITDILSLNLILISIVFYKKYLSEGKFFFSFLTSFFFLLSVLTRETFVLYPFLAFLFLYLNFSKDLKSKFDAFYISFKKTKLLFFTLGCYLSLMLLRKVFLGSGGIGIFVFKHSLKEYFWLFLYFLNSIFGFTFINIRDPRYLFLLICPFILFVIYLFIYNKKKRYLFFLLISIGLVSWPFWFLDLGSRNYFPAIPFFILFLLLSFYYSRFYFNKYLKNALFVFYLFLMLCLGVQIVFNLLYVEKTSSVYSECLQDFVDCDYKVNDSNLYVFLSLPYPPLGSEYWLYKGVRFFSSNNIDSFKFHCFGSYEAFNYSTDISHGIFYSDFREAIIGTIDFKKIKNGFRLISKKDDIYFLNLENKYPYCTILVNDVYDNGSIKDVSIVFDEDFLKRTDEIEFYYWDTVELRIKRCFPG